MKKEKQCSCGKPIQRNERSTIQPKRCSDCERKRRSEKGSKNRKKTAFVFKQKTKPFKRFSGHSNTDTHQKGESRSNQRKTTLKRRKKTGEKEVFLRVWESRPHYCSNPNCKRWLGNEPKAHFFSHIKPKSTHPELRLEESNIQLLCFDCHYEYDFGKKERIQP